MYLPLYCMGMIQVAYCVLYLHNKNTKPAWLLSIVTVATQMECRYILYQPAVWILVMVQLFCALAWITKKVSERN